MILWRVALTTMRKAIESPVTRRSARTWRDLSDARIDERPLGLHAGTQEVLACPDHLGHAAARRLVDLCPRIRSSTFHLHAILTRPYLGLTSLGAATARLIDSPKWQAHLAVAHYRTRAAEEMVY